MPITMTAIDELGDVIAEKSLQIAPFVNPSLPREKNLMFWVDTDEHGQFTLDDDFLDRKISTSRVNTGASAYVTVSEGATLKIDTAEPLRMKQEQEQEQEGDQRKRAGMFDKRQKDDHSVSDHDESLGKGPTA